MIYDGDTRDRPEHFEFVVRTLERLGVSPIVIEDKIGLKRNSLFVLRYKKQEQACIEEFCFKIKAEKKVQITQNFMIIARIESLMKFTNF